MICEVIPTYASASRCEPRSSKKRLFFFNKVKKRKLLYRKKKKNDFLRKAELRQESEIRKRGLLCHIK